MISGIIYDRNDKERCLLSEIVRDGIAIKSDDESDITLCAEKEVFLTALKEKDLNDFCCMDFEKGSGRLNAAALRKSFPGSALLLMVDMDVSPREYVRPDILPSAIVLRPSDTDSLKQTMFEFLDLVLKPVEGEDEKSISIEIREGVTRIPFESIYYVEASAKKIFLRTRKEEYGFYETLSNLERILPDYFVRCHRGYIVNLHKVKKYVGSENALYLINGIMLPVSRNYKSEIREAL